MAFGFLATRAYTPGTQFYQVPIGGGGFMTGLTMALDGTLVCRNDSGMAFKYNIPAVRWDALTTLQSLPPGFQTLGIGFGTYEVVVAPSDSSRIYLVKDGFFFKSTDGGKTFINMPAFFGGNPLPNGTANCNNGACRLNGPKMAVDPNNANICVVGTGVNGVYITKDAGNSFTGPLPIPASPPLNANAAGFVSHYKFTSLLPTTNSSAVGTFVLTFASTTNNSVVDGDYVFDTSNQSAIPANTTVISHDASTVTLSNPLNATVAKGQTITFAVTANALAYLSLTTTVAAASGTFVLTFASTTSAVSVADGDYVFDTTDQSIIPANTTIASHDATTITLSRPLNATLASGHTIGLALTGTAALAYPGYCIAFDKNSTVVSGATQTLYVSGYFNPIYASMDGGMTWSALNSGTFPKSAQSLRVGPDHTVWVVSDGADFSSNLGTCNVWTYSAGGVTPAWTQFTTSQVNSAQHCVAVCPTDSSPNIRVGLWNTSVSGFFYTANWGAATPTWSQYAGGNPPNSTVNADASWLNVSGNKASISSVDFDPSRTDSFVWLAHGLGMYNTNIPASHTTTVPFIGVVSGIENLTPSQSLSSPGPGSTATWLTVWDQGVFALNPLGALATSSTKLIPPGICAGWGMDYASSDPTFMCACCSFFTFNSGFSTDHGFTWQDFPMQNLGRAGCIAATTPRHIVQIMGTVGSPGLPLVSQDQGQSWAIPASLPTVGSGYVIGENKCSIVCADRDVINAPDTFYLYYSYFTNIKTTAPSTTADVTLANVTNLQIGFTVTDSTTSSAIPAGTTIMGINGLDVTLSNPVNVGLGDSLLFTDPGSGIWKSTNGGLSWTQVHFGQLSVGGTSGARLLSVPGTSPSTLLICGSANGPNGTILKSTNGGQDWTNINTGIKSLVDFGIGAPLPGSSYPVTIWMIGTYNNVFGIYKSHDGGANFIFVSAGNPAGALTPMANIGGDMNVYGRAYVSCVGLAWFYCNYVSG